MLTGNGAGLSTAGVCLYYRREGPRGLSYIAASSMGDWSPYVGGFQPEPGEEVGMDGGWMDGSKPAGRRSWALGVEPGESSDGHDGAARAARASSDACGLCKYKARP